MKPLPIGKIVVEEYLDGCGAWQDRLGVGKALSSLQVSLPQPRAIE
ncbi:unnamed protein product, partial [marine sediment metagenome]